MIYSADTTLIPIDPSTPDPALLWRAADVILSGGLVAFPTETVYGLGANALDSEAVSRIFAAKERPANDPLIVHLASVESLPLVAQDIPPLAYALAERFWPGPLTLVLRRTAHISDHVTAAQDTVAVRVPAHEVARGLIAAAGVPIAAPSANRFSRPSPTTAAHVLADLAGRVDMVLDGGSTRIGVESTILDLSGDVPTVLRPGGIPLEALLAVLPHVELRSLAVLEGGSAPAPGTLQKHYSPAVHVLLYSGMPHSVRQYIISSAAGYVAAGRRPAVIMVGDSSGYEQAGVLVVSLGHDETHASANLFAVLRDLETRADVILVSAPSQTGLGLALWDRLWRAADGRVVRVE